MKIPKFVSRWLDKIAVNFITKRISTMKGSWRTTGWGIGAILFGIGAILTAVGGSLIGLLDNDPNTVFSFAESKEAVAAGIASVAAGIGLMKSRDDKVSDDEAGVKQ